MALEISRREREGIVLLDLKGRIVMGHESSHFRDTAIPIVSEPDIRVILNMADIAYIDSTGLGALVMVAGAAKRSNGTVKLLATNARNLELLVTTRLETVFEHFKEEQDAIDSFFPDRRVRKFDILDFVREHETGQG